MMARHLHVMRPLRLLLLLSLAGCTDPAAQHLGGFGDPVRGAAFSAPYWLGDTSRLQGLPAQAARSAVQIEVIADAFETEPRYMHEVSGPALHALRVGRRELRQVLGIAPNAPPGRVTFRLREAAAALDGGQLPAALAALSDPIFTAGGEATLTRLATLPRMPRVSEAAGAAWTEVRRLDSGQRG